MNEFKFYQIFSNLDIINNKKLIGNYLDIAHETDESKAIRKYKDVIWDMQGFMNKTKAVDDNFNMFGEVTLYGCDLNNERVVMRHLALNM